MGLFDRMREMAGMAPAARAVSDDVSPLDLSVRKVALDARRDLLEAPASSVLLHLGERGEDASAVPPPGYSRGRWIQDRVRQAFDPSRDEMTPPGLTSDPVMMGAIERSVAESVVAAPDTGRPLANRVHNQRAHATMRVSDFLADGERLDQRVSEEANHLGYGTVAEIEERFGPFPYGRMDPVPGEKGQRRQWLRDVLRSEHAAARAGLVPPDRIVEISTMERGQTPFDLETPIPRIDWKRGEVARSSMAEQAKVSVGIPDPGLRSRFAGVPGVGSVSIPASSAGRTAWIEAALVSQTAIEAAAGFVAAERRERDARVARSVLQDRAAQERTSAPSRSGGAAPFLPRAVPASSVRRSVDETELDRPPAPAAQRGAAHLAGRDGPGF